MATYSIAHIREQGIDLIIIPLDPAFGRKTRGDQEDIISSLQIHARSAGLKGTVVPVWQEGDSAGFLAPPNWHPFFQSLGWNDIILNLNKELTIG